MAKHKQATCQQGMRPIEMVIATAEEYFKGEDGRMTDRVTPNVGAIRQALDLTQDELARVLGVHRVTVIHWEAGETFPGPMAVKALRRLARKRQVAFVEAPRVVRGAAS